jgi:spore germination protein GerM
VGTGVVSRRAVRVVAGLLMLVAIGTSACGIPTNGTPTAIAKTDVPFHLLTPVTSTTVHPVVRPPVTVPATIYLVEHAQHVYAVSRNIPVPATLSEIIGALLEGPTAAESELGLQSFLSGTATRVRATVADGIATVDFFSANPVQVVGPDQTLAIAQVVFTATEQPGVTGVVFKIDNRAIDVPTASGAEVAGPVKRTSYQPQAPLP